MGILSFALSGKTGIPFAAYHSAALVNVVSAGTSVGLSMPFVSCLISLVVKCSIGLLLLTWARSFRNCGYRLCCAVFRLSSDRSTIHRLKLIPLSITGDLGCSQE